MLLKLLTSVLLLGLWTGMAQAAATLPTLPTANVDTTMPTVDGSTLNATCATLQAQLNAAAALNVNLTHRIILATGTTCTGPYNLPSHTGGTGWILLTGPNLSSLPPPGTRVGLSDAALMPKIQYGETTQTGAIAALTGAQRYRIIGIEFLQNDAYAISYALIAMGKNNWDATNTGYLIVDRSIGHGGLPGNEKTRRFIKADATLGHTAMVDSYCYDIKQATNDTQCFATTQNPGPILVQNSFLQASGENFIACGETIGNSAYQPANITFRLNTVSKRSNWLSGVSGVKTLLELKCGSKVLVEGNTFEDHGGLDGGHSFRLTVRNEVGNVADRQNEVSDLTIRYNLFRRIPNWINAFGAGDQTSGDGPTKHSKRWNIHNNLIYDLGQNCAAGSQCGTQLTIQSGANGSSCTDPTPTCKLEDVTVNHNTFYMAGQSRFVLYVDTAGQIDLDYTNNLTVSNGGYGIFTGTSASGSAALNFGWAGPTWTFTNNGIAGLGLPNGATSASYPAGSGNIYPASASSFLFTDPAAKDFTLQAASPAKNAGSDGKDMGVDFVAYNAGRLGGGTPPPTDTTAPSPVSGLAVVANAGAQSTLTWTTTTDGGGSGLAGYNIRRLTGACGTPATIIASVNSPTATSYVDSTLTASTTYCYSINAFDNQGNQSTYSTGVAVTTPATVYTTMATDAFTRADSGDLGASWDAGYTTVLGATSAYSLVSNQLRVGATGANSLETYNAITTPNDQWAQLTLSALSTPGAAVRAPGLVLRANNPGVLTGYACRAFSHTGTPRARIERWNGAGAHTPLLDDNTTVWATGDKLACEMEGTSIRLYRIPAGTSAKTLLLSTTDATYASGKAGIIHYVASGTTADVQVDDFVVGGFTSSPATPPAILSIDATRTQLTATWTDPTVPSSFRVGTFDTNVYPAFADFTAGVWTYTQPILDSLARGATFMCIWALDAQGVQNHPGSLCDQSLPAIPTDTTAPTVSNGQPTGTLPAGTTSRQITADISEPAACRWSLTDVAYGSMTDTQVMTVIGLIAAVDISGLSDGTSTTVYVGCVDASGNVSANLAITLTVDAAPGDTTLPSTVADLVCTVSSPSQASCVWPAATDNVLVSGYQVYICAGAGCSTSGSAGVPVTATQTILNLASNTTYSVVVRAIDSTGNLSFEDSNVETFTTSAELDITPPPDMSNLRNGGSFRLSVLLVWDAATDVGGGAVKAVLEWCTGANCTDFAVVPGMNNVLGTSLLVQNLSPDTIYRFRGVLVDGADLLSVNYSNIVELTTATTGLGLPRLGATSRVPADSRATAAPRQPRP